MVSSKALRIASIAVLLAFAVPPLTKAEVNGMRANLASEAALRSAMASGAGAGGNRTPGQGYLGIGIRDISDGEVSTLRLKSSRGAEIIEVDHDGPAGKAGLREHDVVLSVNGTPVEREDQLRRILHDLQPGRSVTLVVCRGGTEQTVNATMANRSELERQAWDNHYTVPEPEREEGLVAPSTAPAVKSSFGHSFMSGHLLPMAPAYTGATVDALGAQLAGYFGVKDGRGLLVHEVDENSPAALAGLHAGDVVVRVNGQMVSSKSEWSRSLRDSKGHPVSLTVVRSRGEQTLVMVPDAKHRSQVEPPATPPGERGWLSLLLLR